MDTYKNFTRSLEAFFQQYLIKERGASQQTVRAYGEAFKAYLEYNKALNIKPQKFPQLDRGRKEKLYKQQESTFVRNAFLCLFSYYG